MFHPLLYNDSNSWLIVPTLQVHSPNFLFIQNRLTPLTRKSYRPTWHIHLTSTSPLFVSWPNYRYIPKFLQILPVQTETHTCQINTVLSHKWTCPQWCTRRYKFSSSITLFPVTRRLIPSIRTTYSLLFRMNPLCHIHACTRTVLPVQYKARIKYVTVKAGNAWFASENAMMGCTP
jgi:hypothetical protein